MNESKTLANLISPHLSEQPAIIAEESGISISYRSLSGQVEHLAEVIAGAGFEPGNAVAILLPNCPEFLVLLLALSHAGLIPLPINPASTAEELTNLIPDSNACAVIAGSQDEVIGRVADGLSVPVWRTSIDHSGIVHLTQDQNQKARAGTPPIEDFREVAILLHTSGTSGRPKVVPLTQTNVVSSARNIAANYSLSPTDRTFSVLPFFHGHGLIGVALSTLSSGGAIIIASRFSASTFWTSFRQHGATWYSAVPTIHNILLKRADADGAPHEGPRFIRSCSAPLAPSNLTALEARFGSPVIEAYGITEASHQVCSNPLPPGARKPGTVGPGVGTEIAIIDSFGAHLPAHSAGEIIIRGPGIMRGYLNSPTAASEIFIDGWFRTGDVGQLDDSGYLSITGRIKEIINRGGEKISPVEIDNVLLAHPAVAEAATFPIPDAKYGEAVAALVVLKGESAPESLRKFCQERLAEFKVPKVIRIVSEIPKNALGKVNRRSLAAHFTA